MFGLGPVELILILVIIVMLFGVGKMPELFGAVGKGVREFRKNAEEPTPPAQPVQPVQTVQPVPPAQPVQPVQPPVNSNNTPSV